GFFFTLEYCDGGSADRLARQRGGKLSIAEALPLIMQVLDGLEYAHNLFGPGSGLVHRDVKLANLFLTSAGGGPERADPHWSGGRDAGFRAASTGDQLQVRQAGGRRLGRGRLAVPPPDRLLSPRLPARQGPLDRRPSRRGRADQRWRAV